MGASLREAVATIRAHPLRASLAALAMAAAVATTVIVQTGLSGLARSAREASARAFGSDTFVLAQITASGLSRRELAERRMRNPALTRADGGFLERVAGDRVVYAASVRPTSALAGADSKTPPSPARSPRFSRFATSASATAAR
jgi:putative ABC transport system permease protein